MKGSHLGEQLLHEVIAPSKHKPHPERDARRFLGCHDSGDECFLMLIASTRQRHGDAEFRSRSGSEE